MDTLTNGKSKIRKAFMCLVLIVQVLILIFASAFLLVEMYSLIKGEENCALVNGIAVGYLIFRVAVLVKGVAWGKAMVGVIEYGGCAGIGLLAYVLYKSKPTRDIGRLLITYALLCSFNCTAFLWLSYSKSKNKEKCC